MAPSLFACVLLLAAGTGAQSRWSRQISSYTADTSEWVPLTAPLAADPAPAPQDLKRQVAEPRILAEPYTGFTRPAGFNQDFASRNYYQPNRPLYLQSVPSVPSAPQNFLSDQGFGQSIRFGLSQPNFPLNQGFISPQFNYDQVPAIKARPTVPTNPIKFESFPKTNLPSPQAKPFINQAPKKQAPKFVDGYKLENASSDFTFNQKRRPQSLQKLKFDAPKTETLVPNKSQLDREEVQLLYVPVESLNRGQFNFRSPLTSPQIVGSDLYTQGMPKQSPVKQVFAKDFNRPAQSVESVHFGQDYYNYNSQFNDQVPKFSTIQTPFPTAPPTTPRPKKLKPHQPPLAVFLSYEARKGAQVKVGDVLSSLKNANTIAVLDAVNPLNAPKVFIGPSTLTPPENYVKFELPYLSNIENSEKKLKQLPFFVAPLSYNTPNGFAKIPFPSPHVGSVVINSQIKDTPSTTVATPAADVIPNSYVVTPPSRNKEQNPVTQKPNFSYYSTVSPKTNAPSRQSEYYSFEPQTVSSITPTQKDSSEGIITAPPKTGSYFLSNVGSQYTPEHANFRDNYSQEQFKPYIQQKQEPTTTKAPKTTSKPIPTYPSQLLETHNPYSINQAFHFSTPLDYNTYFEENKDQYSTQQGKTPQQASAAPTSSASPSTTRKPEVATEKQTYQQQSSPNYLQNYSPEIHYEAENPSSRYPAYNSNEYTTKPINTYHTTKPTNTYQYLPESNGSNVATFSSINPPTETQYVDTQATYQESIDDHYDISTTGASEQPTKISSYEQYETSYNSNENKESSTTTTTTTTTTTRRTPLRARGRPRYTTPRTDSQESSSKATVTRRPLRERRPPANRPRYEPNKITTEKPTRKPIDSSETSTKSSIHSSRTRTRGRVQYKSSEGDDGQYSKAKDQPSGKGDLAYQRDILHQNYPVTLMERMSTVDVEALTEPTTKFSSTKNVDTTYDTDNAYTYERASVSQLNANPTSNENSYSSRSQVRTEAPYVPHVPSTREEYAYHSRSSSAPVDAIAYDESSPENEDSYVKHTTPVQKDASAEVASYATEPAIPATEAPSYTVTIKQEESSPQDDNAKFLSQEVSHETEQEVQTTPSYNRVRVRPGVIRQYHQSSSEAPKIKERKRPVQAVTYRPAFDRRRTTMRIEEIGEDLKTKQVHVRPEVSEHRHPVYKPEPTTEPPETSASQESSTKRNQFRRRRPSYTTTSTESSNTKKTYEVKNRFRGRRPTDRPTDKPEVQTDATTTARNTLHTRYSARPRLSERYNKKPEVEESEDQEPNYSINRPKFAEPESDSWSPKISTDSFKPYNPNDIINDRKDAMTIQENEEAEVSDIITARNEYDDVLISVTPATNRLNKKIPDIPPTLEALVEQSKATNSDSPDAMSTFETMLEEVMKSLEEQDQDEYTSSVMKHKGGEIGEIPPERIISSGDSYQKTTASDETTTAGPSGDDSTIQNEDEKDRKGRRRGFWKKVKVRPFTTEAIEAAESQYYSHTVNRLGDAVKPSKTTHDKGDKIEKPHKVTTYKPTFTFKDIFEEEIEALPTVDIPKRNPEEPAETKTTTENVLQKETPTEMSPGDMDLGTGSPDPTVEMITTTEAVKVTEVDRSDGFSFMDYLFGATSSDDVENKSEADTKSTEVEITTEPIKQKIVTTETNVIPEEITAVPDEDSVDVTEFTEIKKSNVTEIPTSTGKSEVTEAPVLVESSSVSSFMNPANVVSTSMSTEVSHETEICFRGKCIKTSKDLL